jgi:predicted PurR-regulated permease PerM
MNANNEETPLPAGSEIERESSIEVTTESAKGIVRRSAHSHRVFDRTIRPQEALAFVGGFIFLMLLGYTMINPIVNPLFALAALIFFLYPFRKVVVTRRTMQLGIGAFLLWLALNLSGALFPFIIAFIVAYIISPLVATLERRGIPRWTTSLALTLGILGIYALIGIFLIPALIGQFQDLFSKAQGLLTNANSMLDSQYLINEMVRLGVPQAQAQDLVHNVLEPQLKTIATALFTGIYDILKNVSSILEGVMNLVLIPILTFYMLYDFPRLRLFVRSTLLQDKPRYVGYARQVDDLLSSYLRGILITSSLVGGMAIAFLSMFNVPYAVVIGILTGVFNLIPTVGMFLNLGVAMIIYIFSPGSFWTNTLTTAAVIAGLHALNSYLIEPRIIGDRVGLPPVLMIASLFAFAHFLGFIGLLIAVPTMAVVVMFLKEWYRLTVARRPVVVTPAPPR